MDGLSFSQIIRMLLGRWKTCVVTFVVIVAIGVGLTAAMTEKYKATATILLDFRGTDPVSGNNVPGQMLPGYLATQLDLIKSHNVALKVVDALGIDKVPEIRAQFMKSTQGRGTIRDWVADRLMNDVKLEPSRESSVIDISYMSPDPRFSAAVANAVAQGYIKMNLELKVDPARQTSAWFDDQLKTLKLNLQKAQNRLSDYQQQNGIVATDERLDSENSRLQELSGQLVAAQTQTYDELSKQRQMDTARSEGKENTSPAILNNPVIQRLKSDIAQVQAKLNTLSSTVDSNHPQYQAASEQLQNLQREYDAEMQRIGSGVRNVTSAARQREGSIRSALEAQKNKVLDFKKQRAEMVSLQGEAESAQRAYDAGLQRLAQTQLEGKLSQTNASLVTPATEPIFPARPRWILNMALTIIVAVNAAIGLALMRELFDRRIRSIADITSSLPVPLLGEITSASISFKRFALLKR